MGQALNGNQSEYIKQLALLALVGILLAFTMVAILHLLRREFNTINL